MSTKAFSINLILIFIIIVLTGCSKNNFIVRKNYQPRVKIEVNKTLAIQNEGIVANYLSPQNIQVRTQPNVPQKQKIKRVKKETFVNTNDVKVSSVKKKTLMEKLATIFVPKKKELLNPIFHSRKKTSGTAKTDNDRIVGLVINLLALAFAIVGLLMIIGMAHGNVWVCFVVAMVFACAAIVMGFIGRMLAFKGIGLLAGVLGILAVMAILVFLLLITVVHIVF
jgi:hypothetical protein